MTVNELRKAGCKVKIIHNRLANSMPMVVLPNGGHTDITVTTPDGKTYFETAHCCDLDPYNKKIGVAVALGRMLVRRRNKE